MAITETATAPASTTRKQIKALLFLEDIAELLGQSTRTIHYRLQHGTLPKELKPLPQCGRKPRWSGRDVAVKYLHLSDADFEIV